MQHAAEYLPHAGRWHVQLLLHDERHGHVPMQFRHVQLQVRDDQRRRLHHLHVGRQGLLRDVASLLRLRLRLHEVRLHVLRLLGRHALLLLHLLRAPLFAKAAKRAAPCKPGGRPICFADPLRRTLVSNAASRGSILRIARARWLRHPFTTAPSSANVRWYSGISNKGS